MSHTNEERIDECEELMFSREKTVQDLFRSRGLSSSAPEALRRMMEPQGLRGAANRCED